MTTYATRLQNGTDTAVRMRMADSIVLHSPGGGKVGGRSGLRNDSGGIVSVSAGTMNVTVSPFVGWLDGGTSDAQGGYPVVNDAPATLAIAPGDATQARVDVIAVVINDTAFDGSGQTNCVLTVIQGTPGAGTPAFPVTCLPLRAINVPAGLSAGTGGLSSGNLGTDYRVYLPNGVLRVASAAERDAANVSARGNVVYRFDTDSLEVWNGSTWRRYSPDPVRNRWAAYTTGVQNVASGSWVTTSGYGTAFPGFGSSTIEGGSGLYSYGLGVITATIDIWIKVQYYIELPNNTTGRRGARIAYDNNDAGAPGGDGSFQPAVSATPMRLSADFDGPLAAGHTLSTQVFQDSGSTLQSTYRHLIIEATPI